MMYKSIPLFLLLKLHELAIQMQWIKVLDSWIYWQQLFGTRRIPD